MRRLEVPHQRGELIFAVQTVDDDSRRIETLELAFIGPTNLLVGRARIDLHERVVVELDVAAHARMSRRVLVKSSLRATRSMP